MGAADSSTFNIGPGQWERLCKCACVVVSECARGGERSLSAQVPV
jgi:hypothetical protein